MSLWIHRPNPGRGPCYSELCRNQAKLTKADIVLLVNSDRTEAYPFCMECAKIAASAPYNTGWTIKTSGEATNG